MDATTPAQRWNHRRDSYRPAGEVIEPSRYGVEVLQEAEARAFVTTHHYSGTYPAARLAVGLRERVRPGVTELVGVCVFSVGMQPKAIPRWTGQEPAAGVELGRFVLLDRVPHNGETWFLGGAFRALEGELGDVRAVLSYADPTPRTQLDGTVLKPGHVGVIYQAHNGRHVGRSAPRSLWLDASGQVVSMRGLSKIRRGERGDAYAYRQLLDAGAPRRRPLEDGAAYVRRALQEGPFRRLRHPGNLAYVWAVGEGKRRTRRELPPTVQLEVAA